MSVILCSHGLLDWFNKLCYVMLCYRKYTSVFLPCPIFTPGKVAQRSINNWNIVEKWRLNTHSLIWIIAIKYRLSKEIDINYFPVYLGQGRNTLGYLRTK
jgi:hypothetical protein